MNLRVRLICLTMLSCTLLACTLAGASAVPGEATPTTAASSATLPPLAPGTQAPTRIPPTPTLAVTVTPSTTPTLTATATLTPTTAPPLVSTGPLDFTISIIGCQPDPARAGGVILKMRFAATGGAGAYTYYRENQPTTRIFERPATKGTAVIDSYRVHSGDGQSIEKKERFTGGQFGCP